MPDQDIDLGLEPLNPTPLIPPVHALNLTPQILEPKSCTPSAPKVFTLLLEYVQAEELRRVRS